MLLRLPGHPLLRCSLVGLALVACAGCSLALTSDEVQCETDADCEERGGELAGTICVESVCVKPDPVDPKWACIGKVEPVEAGNTDTLTARFIDIVSYQPAKDISVKLCNKYDVPCNAPIGTPAPDADGAVTVSIPSELEAYLEVTGPSYYPTLAFLDHVAQEENEVLLLVPKGVVGMLATNAGVTLDESKGIMLLRTTDCTWKPTAGASVTLFPTDMETRFYTKGSAVTPDESQTDETGNAGFVNVTPGTVTVSGLVGPMGERFGQVSTLVRAGTITAQILRPTPEQ